MGTPTRPPLITIRSRPVAALVAGVGLLVAAASVAAQDVSRSPAQVVDAAIAAYNEGNLEAFSALLAPGVKYLVLERDVLRPDLEGVAAVRARLEQQRARLEELRPRIEVLDRIVSDLFVIQRERLTLHPPGREPIAFTSVRGYRIREGRILRQFELPTETMLAAHVPAIDEPAFPTGMGPVVWIDAGHNTMHTAEGTYWAFGEMLRRDGFRVRTRDVPFTDSLPGPGDVLVLSNPLADRNVGEWSLPTPSAFSESEISALVEWVRDGGRLLLIADHMPFPGAAAALGAALGFEFRNGFAVDTSVADGTAYGPWNGIAGFVFRREDGSLAPHPIREGRGPGHAVDSVATFTGQAFRSPAAAVPLLVLSPGTVSLEPDTAWRFSTRTRVVDVGGWHQGAALELGEGRVVVFGEAAQFRPGGGRNLLGDNGRFARNVIEWLAGVALAGER